MVNLKIKNTYVLDLLKGLHPALSKLYTSRKMSCAIAHRYLQHKGKQISYPFSPISYKDPKLSKLCINVRDHTNAKNARVCKLSFKPEDSAMNLQNEMLNIPFKKLLKRDAVPSLFYAVVVISHGVSLVLVTDPSPHNVSSNTKLQLLPLSRIVLSNTETPASAADRLGIVPTAEVAIVSLSDRSTRYKICLETWKHGYKIHHSDKGLADFESEKRITLKRIIAVKNFKLMKMHVRLELEIAGNLFGYLFILDVSRRDILLQRRIAKELSALCLFLLTMSRVDLKVVLLGKEYGGKTSLVERYLNDRFQGEVPYQNTIGAAYGAKKLRINGKAITMGIWVRIFDFNTYTAGSERYEAMSKIYYRGAAAAIVCFDLTDDSSFEKAQYWVIELLKNEEGCKIYLCGTKKDLIQHDHTLRKIQIRKVSDYAQGLNAEVFETSSKTGLNVNDLFEKIAFDFTLRPNTAKSRTSLEGF
uniref:Uncharacterized protein n=1 Tax=Strigamia maritima TaxID=126957 RepID=T1J8R1_STRMM